MRKVVVLAASGVFAVLAAVFLMINGRAKKIFASDTVVNEMDVSGMTKEDLEQEIRDYSLTVTYRDEQGKEVSEKVNGTDFDMSLGKNEEAVSKILNQQGIWEYLTGDGGEHKLDELVQYDETKLAASVEQLTCFDIEKSIRPKNAYISEYDKAEGYRIIEETAGNIIDKEKAYQVIINAVQGMEREINLSEEDCYQKAEITSDDKRLNRALEQLNTYAGAKITYHFDSKKEVLDGRTISKWLKVNKKGKVTIQEEKAAEYILKLRRKYDTIFSSRKFKTSYGKIVTVDGGDYGWWMNSQKEKKELLKLIKAGKKVNRSPEYYQEAESYGKKDYGNTYVEINLAAQHVFLYVDGKKILETDCVTGNASRGYDTPAGTYSITYTERNATLNGENYSTPVKYWMPFNRNIGLHDASWRSSFGGEIYKYNGSHGCVNLPPDKAAKLFQYVKKGMPVICYNYLPSKDVAKPAVKVNDTVKQQEPAKKNNSEVEKNSTSDSKNRKIKKNNASDKKSNTTKKDNESDKKSNITKKDNTSDKKSNTAKKDNTSDKKNNTAKKENALDKKNNTAKKKNASDKKSNTTKKENASDKKNNTTKKKNAPDKKSNTAKNNSSAKKDNTLDKKDNGAKSEKTISKVSKKNSSGKSGKKASDQTAR
ncbi:MAG: L,D-transpeptidase family protein [Lachnospiraceae bacterium]|nr:L,D-transpeptidase family protein [Lachnospiraceae bacterium]